jgi:hypothetical protein
MTATLMDANPNLKQQVLPNYKKQWAADLAARYQQPSAAALFTNKGRLDGAFAGGETKRGSKIEAIGGGYTVKFPVITEHAANGEWTTPWGTSSGSTGGMSKWGETPLVLRRERTDWNVLEDGVLQGDALLMDIKKQRIPDLMRSHFEAIYNGVWGIPTDEDDITSLRGIPYWLQPNNAAEGLVGGNPPGHSSRAGITNDRWKNYVFHYDTATLDDLIQVVRQARLTMKYAAYPDVPMDQQPHLTGRYFLLCDFVTFNAISQLPIQQNSQQPNYYNLVVSGARVNVDGVYFIYDSALDDTTKFPNHPLYMIDADTWATTVLKNGSGDWWYQLSPVFPSDRSQPLARTRFLWSYFSLACMDLQRNAVIHQTP